MKPLTTAAVLSFAVIATTNGPCSLAAPVSSASAVASPSTAQHSQGQVLDHEHPYEGGESLFGARRSTLPFGEAKYNRLGRRVGPTASTLKEATSSEASSPDPVTDSLVPEIRLPTGGGGPSSSSATTSGTSAILHSLDGSGDLVPPQTDPTVPSSLSPNTVHGGARKLRGRPRSSRTSPNLPPKLQLYPPEPDSVRPDPELEALLREALEMQSSARQSPGSPLPSGGMFSASKGETSGAGSGNALPPSAAKTGGESGASTSG